MTAAKNVREALEEVLALSAEADRVHAGSYRAGKTAALAALSAKATALIRTHGPALLASLSATAAGDAPDKRVAELEFALRDLRARYVVLFDIYARPTYTSHHPETDMHTALATTDLALFGHVTKIAAQESP